MELNLMKRIINVRSELTRVLALLFIFLSISLEVFSQTNITLDSLTQVLKAGKEDSLKYKTYVDILKYYHKIGDFNSAKQTAQAALTLSEKIKYPKGVADSYNNIGLADDNLGNFQAAEENYLNSLKIREEIGGSKGLSFTYNNLGNIYRRQNKYPEALTYFIKSLKIKEELNDKSGMALTYNNIGLIYKAQDNDDEALRTFLESLNYYSQVDDKKGLAMVYNNCGLLKKKSGDSAGALTDFNKALAYNKETGNRNWMGANLINIATQYRSDADNSLRLRDTSDAMLQYAKALEALDEAFKLNEFTGNKSDYCSALLAKGEIYRGMGNYKEADKYITQALIVAKAININSLTKECYVSLAELNRYCASLPEYAISEKIKYWNDAYTYFELAQSLKDSIISDENTKQLAELKTKFETEKKDKEIVLLNREKDIQQLSIKEQQAALLVSKLQSDKTTNELELVNQAKAFQEMELTKTQQELVTKMLEAKAQESELKLEKKDSALKKQQLSNEKLLRNSLLVGSLVLILIAGLLFNRFKLNQKLAHQKVIMNQRRNISADLHDDVGSTLSSISIYSEAIKNKFQQHEPEKVMELVNKIGESARETISNMSDIVWSINPENDKGNVVFSRMESFASSVLSSKNILLEFSGDEKLNNLEYSMEVRQNLFLIFKEAINNAVKYSNAKRVSVVLNYSNNKLVMRIADDGDGFDPGAVASKVAQKGSLSTGGNGLLNMQVRANQLNGTFKITSSPTGTIIDLELPIS